MFYCKYLHKVTYLCMSSEYVSSTERTSKLFIIVEQALLFEIKLSVYINQNNAFSRYN